MKKALFLLIFVFAFVISCTEETPRSKLLEYKIGDKTYSYDGFAIQVLQIIRAMKSRASTGIFITMDKPLSISRHTTAHILKTYSTSRHSKPH